MISTLEILKPADDLSLISLYEAKLALNFASSTDETLDDQLEMMIRWSSDEIATMCNRVFALETVRETVTQIGNSGSGIFLSHFPVVSIDTVSEDGTGLSFGDDFTLDSRSGMLIRSGSATIWSEPTVITYTGGYELPFGAPPALQQAALLLTREAYNAAIRGDSTIRSIAHKESRVVYFDPNAMLRGVMGGAGAGGSPARKSVANLLTKFTTYWI